MHCKRSPTVVLAMVSGSSNLFILLILLPLLAIAQSSRCYWGSNGGVVYDENFTPCGDTKAGTFIQCCNFHDSCGADGFCYSTLTQAWKSGYYLGGCTDSSLNDASCPKKCGKYPPREGGHPILIVYYSFI